MDLLADFGPAIRWIYYGFRAVSLGRSGMPITALDERELKWREKSRLRIEMGGRFAVTGSLFPPLPLQVAHIVPYALGRTHSPQISQFWRLVRLLWPQRVGQIWALAGGGAVNSRANFAAAVARLACAAGRRAGIPGAGFLVGPITRLFEVVFTALYPLGRYVTVQDGVCVELRDGHRLAPEMCGDATLHRTIDRLRAIAAGLHLSEGKPRAQPPARRQHSSHFIPILILGILPPTLIRSSPTYFHSRTRAPQRACHDTELLRPSAVKGRHPGYNGPLDLIDDA